MNLTLKDKILHIQLKKPLVFFERVPSGLAQVKERFEPKKTGRNEAKLEQFYAKSPILRGLVDDVRTSYIMSSVNNDGEMEELSSTISFLLNGIGKVSGSSKLSKQ